MINHSETQTLESLLLVSSLDRECSFQFPRFVQIVINLVPTWTSNWCVWVPLRPESKQKWGLEHMQETVTTKVPTPVINMLQKEGPKNCFVNAFWGPHASMVSRACPGRLPGPKTFQNGGLDMDFILFKDLAFTFFGDTLEIFRVFYEQRIDSTRC